MTSLVAFIVVVLAAAAVGGVLVVQAVMDETQSDWRLR